MSSSPTSRELAVRVAQAVADGRHADQALAAELATSHLPEPAVARATALAFATVRLTGRADAVLRPLLARPLAQAPPALLAVLRVGAVELLWMERTLVPAAVDDLVTIARRRAGEGPARAANAVLRRVAGDRDRLRRPPAELSDEDWLVDWESLPRWLARRWLSRFGGATARRLAAAANSEPPVCLRVNRLRATREAVLASLAAAGLAAEPGELAPSAVRLRSAGRVDALPGFADGWHSAQDEGAQLVAPLAALRPGQRAADLCAAPGGKAAHLAELSDDAATISAVDRNEARSERLVETVRRLGLRSVTCRTADARELARELEPQDVVLLDAPCTGTGTLARRADRRWQVNDRELRAAVELQTELLDAAADLVGPGGLLIYSTCSLEAEENEQALATLAERRPELRPDSEGIDPPPGWDADTASLLLLPRGGLHDGFFLARRRRQP